MGKDVFNNNIIYSFFFILMAPVAFGPASQSPGPTLGFPLADEGLSWTFSCQSVAIEIPVVLSIIHAMLPDRSAVLGP